MRYDIRKDSRCGVLLPTSMKNAGDFSLLLGLLCVKLGSDIQSQQSFARVWCGNDIKRGGRQRAKADFLLCVLAPPALRSLVAV